MKLEDDVNSGLVFVVTAFCKDNNVLGILAASSMENAERLAEAMLDSDEDIQHITSTTLMIDKFNQTETLH